MDWKQSEVLGMNAWQRSFGLYSFLILKDNTGYVCSYKFALNRAICFYGSKETKQELQASKNFYYFSLEAAMNACELKYRELLERKVN